MEKRKNLWNSKTIDFILFNFSFTIFQNYTLDWMQNASPCSKSNQKLLPCAASLQRSSESYFMQTSFTRALLASMSVSFFLIHPMLPTMELSSSTVLFA